MDRHIAKIVEEADAQQNADLGDPSADLVVHLHSGHHFRGHVSLVKTRQGTPLAVTLWSRLYAEGPPGQQRIHQAPGKKDLGDEDAGTAEVPFHIAGEAISHVHYWMSEGC